MTTITDLLQKKKYPHCSSDATSSFDVSMIAETWRVNGLMLLNAIMVVFVVVVNIYVRPGRHHPLVHLLFLGSSTLFLPIISNVATTLGSQYNTGYLVGSEAVAAQCEPGIHIILVLVWTGLVVVIAINTSAVVAGDEREGRNNSPPVDLLIKAVWLAYLMYSTTSTTGFHETTSQLETVIGAKNLQLEVFNIFALLYALTAGKLFQRYLAFLLARRSVALGRNPRLIVGYMAQLEESHPPALVVKGEETAQVEELPSGYTFNGDETKRKDLVTLDRVWRSDGMLLRSAVEPKDLCFSFALFKLLRCRFAKYSILEAGLMRTRKFFLSTYLQGEDYERVFRVIADELSFIHDYYYSSMSVAFSNSMLPFLSILISLFSIGYCLFMYMFIQRALQIIRETYSGNQIVCFVWCPGQPQDVSPSALSNNAGYGSNYFDTVPVYLVLSVVVLSEIRAIVAYLCSNRTKVYLVCKYISNDLWNRSTIAHKCIGFVFKYFRSRFVTHWDDKMSQYSVLMLHCPRRLLRLRDRKKKVKVPSEVKSAIFEALKGEGLTSEQTPVYVGEGRKDGALLQIRPPSFPGSSTGNAFSACHGKGIADTILAWHIATSVFEVKNRQSSSSSSDPNKIAATHLSRYCAYLVACRPELLPDDDLWCKSLYKAVKKNSDRVLSKSNRRRIAASMAEADQSQHLVHLLTEDDSNHEVLKNGAKLGKRLVDSETTTWEALARFWAEMILFVAPSENLDGHAEAIARGGELITLLWTLLAHAGIVDRLPVANYAAGDRV